LKDLITEITCEHQLLLAITDLLNIILEGKTPILVRRAFWGQIVGAHQKNGESALLQWVIYGEDWHLRWPAAM